MKKSILTLVILMLLTVVSLSAQAGTKPNEKEGIVNCHTIFGLTPEAVLKGTGYMAFGNDNGMRKLFDTRQIGMLNDGEKIIVMGEEKKGFIKMRLDTWPAGGYAWIYKEDVTIK